MKEKCVIFHDNTLTLNGSKDANIIEYSRWEKLRVFDKIEFIINIEERLTYINFTILNYIVITVFLYQQR